MIHNSPVLAICGWSGSGKTTLIESILPHLYEKDLKVVVVKHISHEIDVDRPGKDTHTLFHAGADVVLQSSAESFSRNHETVPKALNATLNQLIQQYDLVIVEGHKETPLPKIWLDGPDRKLPPGSVENIEKILPWDSDRQKVLLSLIDKWLPEKWIKAPLMGCVLIGGKSSRLGQPKHLLEINGRTWLERTVELMGKITDKVVIAGEGEIPDTLTEKPLLTDPPDIKGPMAGIMAAMRWMPQSSWIIAACDLPNISIEALEWLISMRAPGVWSVIPKLPGSVGIETMFAYYDFRAKTLLEELVINQDFQTSKISSSPKVITPLVPEHLAECWQNINTNHDLNQFLKRKPDQ